MIIEMIMTINHLYVFSLWKKKKIILEKQKKRKKIEK